MNTRGEFVGRCWRRMLGTGLVVLWGAVLPVYAVGTAPAAEHPAIDQLWRDVLKLVDEGHFDDASAKVARLIQKDPSVAQLAEWLDAWHEQAQMRADLTQADYAKYVGWAKKYRRKGDLPKALNYTVRALGNAVSKDAFRKEAWVRGLIEEARREADKLRGDKQWLDALSLYFQIGAILDHDPQIKKLARQCRIHARIDAVYTEDRRWEEGLAGIEPRMVDDAFRQIQQKYVEEPDFRAITEAGLEQMLLLTESAALPKLFESLNDDLERGMFETRIRENLKKVQQRENVDFRVAREQFNNVLRINRQTLQLPEKLVVKEYVEGCLEEMDEFTSMIWPAQFREFEKHTRGDFVGVGIQIRRRYNSELKDYEVKVVSPIEDSPAYDAGVQAGDIITKVNGQSILGISLTKAVDTITGPIGTSVRLSIRRESEPKELGFTLTRQSIRIQSIKGFARDPQDDQKWRYLIDPDHGIGYIRVTNFQENTVEDLTAAIDSLAKHDLRGLILDLRFDPGGLLRSAVQFSELFLDKGDKIVSTRGLHSPEWPVYASRQGPYRDLPLVILVNDSSASASEIVSGALKDHHRALIVGERTFGKFSVQNLIQLARTEAHLKLTTARYYLPSGKSLHREENSVTWGVEPNIHVPLVAKEVTKIWQGFRKRDIIGRGAHQLAQKVLDEEKKDIEAETDRLKKERQNEGASGDASPKAPSKTPTPIDVRPDDATTQPKGTEVEEEVDRNDRPDIDPQLDAALLAMRAHLMELSHRLVAKTPPQAEHMQ